MRLGRAILQPQFKVLIDTAQDWMVAMVKVTALLATSLIVMSARIAVADDPTPWALCVAQDTFMKARIIACTTVINTEQLSPIQLSSALQYRGCSLIANSMTMFSAALTRREQGSQDLDKAIGLDPANAPARVCRGHYLATDKKFAEGIKELDQAIRINPDLVGAYVRRGIMFDAVGRYNEAIEDFDRAEAIAPSSESLSSIHLHRAAAFSHKGDQAASREDCDRAVHEMKMTWSDVSGVGFESYGISFHCKIGATPAP